MKLISLLLSFLLLTVQPALAAVGMVGFGQSAAGLTYESVAGDYTSGTSDTTLTVTKPTGTVSGDTLIAISASYTSAVTPPSGWSTVLSRTSGITVFSKTAGGSEPESYDFTVPTFSNANVCAIRVSGTVTSITAETPVSLADYNTTVNYAAPNITTSNNIVIWAGVRNTGGSNQPVMSSITRGTLIYNSGLIATAQSLWVAQETNPATGSPITAAVGTLGSAQNNKSGTAIVIK